MTCCSYFACVCRCSASIFKYRAAERFVLCRAVPPVVYRVVVVRLLNFVCRPRPAVPPVPLAFLNNATRIILLAGAFSITSFAARLRLASPALPVSHPTKHPNLSFASLLRHHSLISLIAAFPSCSSLDVTIVFISLSLQSFPIISCIAQPPPMLPFTSQLCFASTFHLSALTVFCSRCFCNSLLLTRITWHLLVFV